MKNTITLVLLLVTFNFFAQTNGELVIFSNLGERFFVILNGEKQNQIAEGNVKVDGLQPGFYSCKVLSENNIFALDKNFEVKAGMRLTMRIVETKGVYKLRYFSETPTSESQTTTSGQTVVVYQPVGTTVTTPVTQTQTQTTTTTTQTTSPTTVNTGVNTGGESINVSINMSETGVSTNISGTGLEEESNYTQTTTVTTTSSTSTTGTQVTDHNHHDGHDHHTTHPNPPVTNSNCLVDNAGMTKVVKMIKDESFSDTKMGIAKQFTKGRCLTVAQIKEITQLFSFSEDKMEYVKYAYDYCMNTQDYYELAEVFTFSDDKDQLNGFINSK